MEGRRDFACDVDGDSIGNEVMQAYHQAMNDIRDEVGGNDIGEGVNDVDDEGSSSDEDADANADDEEVDDFDGEEDFVGDDDDAGSSESGFVDGDECSDTDANNTDEGLEGNSNSLNESTYSDQNPDESFVIADIDDIVKIDLFNLTNEDVSKMQFVSLVVAYKFYCWFAKMNGFVVRKGQVIKNKNGEVLQQTFLCNLEGFRQERWLTAEARKRGPKHETRCGCGAKFRVHIDTNSQRWYISVFTLEHNHDMLNLKHCGLLAAHRKLTKSDKIQVKNFGNVGIKVTQMIVAFANAADGYDKVGFLKKDVHNQISRQRKVMSSDARGAIRYLIDLHVKDPHMFVVHTIDANGRLQNLFWSDAESQKNYELFGDVVAFDATYKKNKYSCCPFVVFSGVNHDNQTVSLCKILIFGKSIFV